MHFGVSRGVMSEKDRRIDRYTKPVQPARPAMDQLMGIRIADLPKVLTKQHKTGETLPDVQARNPAQREYSDNNQAHM